MKNSAILFTVLLLFIGQNLLTSFLPDFFLFHIIPAFYFVLFLFCKSINSVFKRNNIIPLCLLLVLLVLSLFNKFTKREVDFLMFLNSLAFPVFIVLVFKQRSFHNNVKLRLRLKKIVIAFFLINAVWAIIERILLFNAIPYVYDGEVSVFEDVQNFSSSSLLGHRLANSLVMTTIMMFILFDKNQTIGNKLCLYTVGMMASFCYNSRFFIIYNFFCFIMFVIYNLTSNNILSLRNKRRLLCLSIIIIIVAMIAAFKYNIAGRLFIGFDNDNGSGEARLLIFDIFNFFSVKDFLLGIPDSDVEIIYKHAGLNIINENCWIIFLMRFGLLFEITIFTLYVFMIKRIMRSYDRFVRLFIPLSFFICISSFNSIATTESFLGIFIFLALLYHPIRKKYKRIHIDRACSMNNRLLLGHFKRPIAFCDYLNNN